MDTEKAIEFCEQIKWSNVYIPKKFASEIENVKVLLKQGEKYKQMWNALYAEYGMCPIRKNDEEGYMSNILYKILEEIEQKYFPKQIIKEVVKGVTEQIKEGAEITNNNKGEK